MTLNDNQKAGLFKILASKNLYDAGLEFGLDKHYKTTVGVRNAVYRVYQQVRKDPEQYGLSPDTVELVVNSVSNRSVSKAYGNSQPSLREKNEAHENRSIKELVESVRLSSLKTLERKIAEINSSKKNLKSVGVGELAKVFGIMFDKGQIVRGEATEHVAVMSKNIDKNLSPEDALNMVLKMREINNEEKEKAKSA